MENINTFISDMILSASGFRGIFAESGDEESKESRIPGSKSIFAAACALAFSNYLYNLGKKSDIILARDTRPTGIAIAQAIILVLLNQERTVRWLDISAAPEIMAYAKSLDSQNNFDSQNCQASSNNTASGFIYITASHNPIGHNGLKFGLTDGGVLPGPEAEKLIEELKNILNSQEMIVKLKNILYKSHNILLDEVYDLKTEYKNKALFAYNNFTCEVISGFPHNKAQEVLAVIRKGLQHYPLGVCADFNGSARAISIDRDFITGLGAGFKSINDKPGDINHAIIPEGDSLIPCTEFLERCNRENPSFIMGYMPDCDGDRGNLVLWDNKEKKARPLDAQEVFALACIAELSYLVWTGQIMYDSNGDTTVRAALAVNGATSLRVDRIAEAFGIKIYRSETGEANVVGLARKLREKGYIVRILGEGSNGGNITHPAAVRDPLNTVLAIIKLLAIRTNGSKKGLFEIWCEKSNQNQIYRDDFSLADIITSMPAFTTTSVASVNGVLNIKNTDHMTLKEMYQNMFLKAWEERRQELYKKFNITDWDVESFNGSEEKRGIKNFGESGSGGLKISFFNANGRKIACMWTRGSKTEPLFRVMADTEGHSPDFEQYILEWHRNMLTKANNM